MAARKTPSSARQNRRLDGPSDSRGYAASRFGETSTSVGERNDGRSASRRRTESGLPAPKPKTERLSQHIALRARRPGWPAVPRGRVCLYRSSARPNSRSISLKEGKIYLTRLWSKRVLFPGKFQRVLALPLTLCMAFGLLTGFQSHSRYGQH